LAKTIAVPLSRLLRFKKKNSTRFEQNSSAHCYLATLCLTCLELNPAPDLLCHACRTHGSSVILFFHVVILLFLYYSSGIILWHSKKRKPASKANN
jgi:hypothetical protein